MKISKNMVRVISLVILVLMLAMVVNPVAAASSTAGGVTLPTGEGATVNDTGIQNVANNVIGVLKVVGAAIAVIVLLIMGIKYLMASVEEKADFKKAMIPYVVGALLVFAAPWIAGFIIDLAASITG